MTGALISWFCPETIIDPACGDGTIVAAAHRAREISGAYMSDLSRPNFYHVGTTMRPLLPPSLRVSCQSIEETLADDGYFDLIVLTEILEHVEDPVEILRMARSKARNVVASSPLIPDNGQLDDNPEHLWQFDAPGFSDMLNETGWEPIVFVPITLMPPQFIYSFQLWGAQ